MCVEHRNRTWALMLLFLSGALCKSWKVKYEQQRICAVKGSSAVIPCSFKYPPKRRVQSVMWGHGRYNAYAGPFIFDSNLNNTSSKFQYIGDKQHDCSLKIHQVAHNDTGEYTFRFTTDLEYDKWTGKVDAPRLQVVDLNISVTTHNGSGTTKEGDFVNLTCVNDCDRRNNLSPVFTWFKNGELINEGHVLYLTNVSSKNSGNYTCSLKRHTGTTSGVLNIDVEYGPKNTSVSASPSMELDPGSNFTLICSSHANPPVMNYTWFKIANDNIEIVGQQSVFVSGDAGRYFCSTTNKHGSQNSSVVTLKVKEYKTTYGELIVAPVAVLLLVTTVIAVRRVIRKRARAPEAERDEGLQNAEYVNWPVFGNNQSQEGLQCEGTTTDIVYTTVGFPTRRESNTEEQTAPDDDDKSRIYSTVCRVQQLNPSYIEPS